MQPLETKPSWSHCRLFVLALLLFGVFGQHLSGVSPVRITLPAESTGAQIQKALDNLPAEGEVILAPGQYEISVPLLLRHNNQTLRGSGATTILHLVNGGNCPVVIIGPPLDEPDRPTSHVRLANLLIDGNRRNQHVEFWKKTADGSEINNNGVHIWNVSDVAVDHIICCRCRSGGLVTANVRRLRVDTFHSYDNEFDGLACYQTEESRFNALSLHDNVAAGISLDLDFNRNCITNAVLTGNDVGIFMRDSRDNEFRCLTVAKSRNDGVFMAQSVTRTAKGWRLIPNTQCTGNNFDNIIIRDCGGHAFQVNDASCTNNAITGACFLRNAKGGLGQPATNTVRLAEVARR